MADDLVNIMGDAGRKISEQIERGEVVAKPQLDLGELDFDNEAKKEEKEEKEEKEVKEGEVSTQKDTKAPKKKKRSHLLKTNSMLNEKSDSKKVVRRESKKSLEKKEAKKNLEQKLSEKSIEKKILKEEE